jgi:hypothetical protein
MMFKVLLKNNFPWLTVLLASSCLVSTIPQFFLPSFYSEITGQYAGGISLLFLTLPAFTHSPGILINHLAGNLLVIILFGGLTEIFLGTPRFSLVSLATFGSTTLVNFFHFSPGGQTHGASGLCFGYIMFFLFFIIVVIENRKFSLLRHPAVLSLVFLAVFCVSGLPVLEVVVLKKRFFENFGQTSHLISYFAATPFLLVWRKDIEENFRRFISNEEVSGTGRIRSGSFYLWIAILSVNLLATLFAVISVINVTEEKFSYSVTPLVGESITALEEEIVVAFDTDVVMDSERLIKKSITYSTPDVPGIQTEWVNSRRMVIRFSRPFIDGESIHLIYEITREREMVLNKIESVELLYE